MLTTRSDPRAAVLHYRNLAGGPKTLDRENRTVEATISTENPVPMIDWIRMEVVPEILLADGAIFPDQVPLLDNHQRASVKSVLGSIRDLRREGREIAGRLHFSSMAQKEFTQVAEGHVTDVSVGYRVLQRTFIPDGSSQSIGSRTYAGPVNVVTSWRAMEVSLTSIGADQQAKLRGLDSITAGDMQRALDDYAGESSVSLDFHREDVADTPDNGPDLDTFRQWLEDGFRFAFNDQEARHKLDIDAKLIAAGITDQTFARDLYRLQFADQVDAEIERYARYVRRW